MIILHLKKTKLLILFVSTMLEYADCIPYRSVRLPTKKGVSWVQNETASDGKASYFVTEKKT